MHVQRLSNNYNSSSLSSSNKDVASVKFQTECKTMQNNWNCVANGSQWTRKLGDRHIFTTSSQYGVHTKPVFHHKRAAIATVTLNRFLLSKTPEMHQFSGTHKFLETSPGLSQEHIFPQRQASWALLAPPPSQN